MKRVADEISLPNSEDIRERIQKGRLISKGNEASIYEVDGAVWKVYPENASKEKVQRNINFLIKAGGHNRTAKICKFASAELGLIKMSLIPGMTLKSFMNTSEFKNPNCKDLLLLKLHNARCVLPHNIEFTDFTNPENIMVEVGYDGWPVSVSFIEGGKENEGVNNAILLFFQWAAAFLHATRTETYKRLRYSLPSDTAAQRRK